MTNQLPTKADKTTQSARFKFMLDKEYDVELFKHINGTVKYEVVVHGEENPTRIEVVQQTILNVCKTHGAFEPKKDA